MLFTLVSISCNNWKFQVKKSFKLKWLCDQSDGGFKFLFNKVIYVRSRVCLWIEVISKNAFQPFPELVFPFRKSAAFPRNTNGTEIVNSAERNNQTKCQYHLLFCFFACFVGVAVFPSGGLAINFKKLLVPIRMMC